MKWKDTERERILWFPTIDAQECTGCRVYLEFCRRNVYRIEDSIAKIENPLNCLVGYTGYRNVCPVGAISFPDIREMRETIHELRGEVALQAEQEDGGEHMSVVIRIFGPSSPCAKCQAAEKVAREVAKRFGEATVEKCDVFSKAAEKYDIMMTPTVMVDNITVEVGKVPSAENLERAVREVLSSQKP